MFVLVPGADFRSNPQWWYRFEYELDRQRGFDFQEDLWMPGLFSRELAPGDRLGVVLSTEDPRGRDAFALFEKEKRRREKILKALPRPRLSRPLPRSRRRLVHRAQGAQPADGGGRLSMVRRAQPRHHDRPPRPLPGDRPLRRREEDPPHLRQGSGPGSAPRPSGGARRGAGPRLGGRLPLVRGRRVEIPAGHRG